jgi:hypothetical protein
MHIFLLLHVEQSPKDCSSIAMAKPAFLSASSEGSRPVTILWKDHHSSELFNYTELFSSPTSTVVPAMGIPPAENFGIAYRVFCFN